MPTGIEWTDETLNLASYCWKISPGCAYCYAERIALRQGGPRFLPGEAHVVLHPERLMQPVKWRRPRRIFVCSMSDLFHEEIPDDFIVHAFAVMAATPRHTYLVLTKRPDRMVKRLSRRGFAENVWGQSSLYGGRYPGDWTWPLPNVQLGVSVENQHFADVRIPLLLGAEAALYWASLEPLLGPVDLSRWLPGHGRADGPTLGWVVVGGESMGPPHRALVEPCSCTEALFGGRRRPVASCLACGGTGYKPSWKALQWVLSIRDQCLAAGVPFYFKQWGGSVKKGGTWGGDLLQGRVWHEYPSLAQGFR